MDEQDGTRDLARIKWLGVVPPVVFVWAFEVLRFAVLDEAFPRDTVHAVAALLMASSVVLFALLMGSLTDRVQRRTVAQNRDLTLTHSVSAAIRAPLGLEDMLDAALARMVELTGALAGVVTIEGPRRGPVVVRRPRTLSPGLAWVRALLDDLPDDVLLAPSWSLDRTVDSAILDVPLIRGRDRLGRIRLVYHPAVRTDVSSEALADIAGELATAVELGRRVEDLRMREHERQVLYEVALQLTGRGGLREVLDVITRHSRELLVADRVVVCLSDAVPGSAERLALTDNGATCLLGHPGGDHAHARNPACPLIAATPAAFASRPLRAGDLVLGELCAVRADGPPFEASERELLGALADMAAIAVNTARLREAEEQWTIVSERDRIARELHDSLAQVLGVIHLRLRALDGAASTAAGRDVAREIAEVADIADEAYRDVREAILGLRETISPEVGLEGALRDYLRKYARQTGIHASLVCDGDPRRALPPRSEVQLLRVVQEALTNVRKHAGATRVVVRMDCTTPTPTISIEDDGTGFDPDRAVASLDGGFGLTSMRERVHQIGGNLALHTAPGEGTRVVVRLGPEEDRGAPAVAAARAAG